MTTKKTKIVLMLNHKNNSKELFDKWYQKKQINTQCAEVSCSNAVNDAYVVAPVSNLGEKYTIPLCRECYVKINSSISQTNNDFTDFGQAIKIDSDLLLKYGTI